MSNIINKIILFQMIRRKRHVIVHSQISHFNRLCSSCGHIALQKSAPSIDTSPSYEYNIKADVPSLHGTHFLTGVFARWRDGLV